MSYTKEQAIIEIGKKLIEEYIKNFPQNELYKIYTDKGSYSFTDDCTTPYGNRYTIVYPFICMKLNNYANYSILVIYNDQEDEKVKIDFNLIPTNTKVINDILDFLQCIENINTNEIFKIFKSIKSNNKSSITTKTNPAKPD